MSSRPPRNNQNNDSNGGEGSASNRRRWTPRRGPKMCQFYADKLPTLHYRQTDILRHFISPEGKIMPRRQTGCSAKDQRKITRAIKHARHMALLPFVGSSRASDRD